MISTDFNRKCNLFTLKDNQGRKVFVKGHCSPEAFFAQHDDSSASPVAEAVVAVTDRKDGLDLIPDEEYCDTRIRRAGFDPSVAPFEPKATRYGGVVNANMKNNWEDPFSYRIINRKRRYVIAGREVDEATYKKLEGVVTELNSMNWIADGDLNLQPWDPHRRDEGKASIHSQQALEMIGVGQTVTAESLKKGCAKGEIRPRLWLGDSVEVTIRKETVTGRITGMGKKVSVLRSDSKKGSYAYAAVKRVEGGVCWDKEAVKELDSTLAANFKYVLGQAHRIYKAAVVVRESVKFPVFPNPGDRKWDSRSLTDAPTCECPLCGWPMADFQQNKEFQCCFCRVRGIIAHQDMDTVTLLMLRQPAKNKFALRESKCCANCGLFRFEVGRQGKRSTGYCQATNQCVQAYSTCVNADGDEGYWFPRTPAEYAKQMTQHTTNLGYGVTDARNTKRRDIRDTVYREEDHAAEKKRADRARLVYAAAYAKFMAGLAELATKRHHMSDEFTEEQKEGVREHYQQVLSDGC